MSDRARAAVNAALAWAVVLVVLAAIVVFAVAAATRALDGWHIAELVIWLALIGWLVLLTQARDSDHDGIDEAKDVADRALGYAHTHDDEPATQPVALIAEAVEDTSYGRHAARVEGAA